MEILLWLVPPAVVTVLAMAWVSWLGREGRGEVGREEATARMARVLEREPRPARQSAAGTGAERQETSTGVAVRRGPARRTGAPQREPAPSMAPAATPDPPREPEQPVGPVVPTSPRTDRLPEQSPAAPERRAS